MARNADFSCNQEVFNIHANGMVKAVRSECWKDARNCWDFLWSIGLEGSADLLYLRERCRRDRKTLGRVERLRYKDWEVLWALGELALKQDDRELCRKALDLSLRSICEQVPLSDKSLAQYIEIAARRHQLLVKWGKWQLAKKHLDADRNWLERNSYFETALLLSDLGGKRSKVSLEVALRECGLTRSAIADGEVVMKYSVRQRKGHSFAYIFYSPQGTAAIKHLDISDQTYEVLSMIVGKAIAKEGITHITRDEVLHRTSNAAGYGRPPLAASSDPHAVVRSALRLVRSVFRELGLGSLPRGKREGVWTVMVRAKKLTMD